MIIFEKLKNRFLFCFVFFPCVVFRAAQGCTRTDRPNPMAPQRFQKISSRFHFRGAFGAAGCRRAGLYCLRWVAAPPHRLLAACMLFRNLFCFPSGVFSRNFVRVGSDCGDAFQMSRHRFVDDGTIDRVSTFGLGCTCDSVQVSDTASF